MVGEALRERIPSSSGSKKHGVANSLNGICTNKSGDSGMIGAPWCRRFPGSKAKTSFIGWQPSKTVQDVTPPLSGKLTPHSMDVSRMSRMSRIHARTEIQHHEH